MKEKTSLTLKDSAVFLANNDYLRDVAMLVIGYGTAINIVEGEFTNSKTTERETSKKKQKFITGQRTVFCCGLREGKDKWFEAVENET